MGKNKKAKLGTLGLVLVSAGIVGAVLAVVGLFVPWFASTAKALGASETEFFGLFHDFKLISDDVFPLGVVQAFGIIAVVTAVLSIAVMLLKTFGIVKVGGLAKLILAAATVVMGILAIVFAGSFVGSLTGIDMGALASVTYAPAFGAFFTGIGAIVSGAALFLKK